MDSWRELRLEGVDGVTMSWMHRILQGDVLGLLTAWGMHFSEGGGGSGSWTTLSGATPLTLANAVASAIKRLVQFGLATQESEPTPSTPVDIMCNNGALKLVDNELPQGYRRITEIRFDGNTWYETEESLTGDDDVTMTLANTSSTGQNVFGSYNGTAEGRVNFSLFIYGANSTSYTYFRYGGQLVRPRYGSGKRTITFGKSGTSGFETNVSVTATTFTTPANTYIGMLPNSTSPAFTGSIVGNITVGSRLKWIPCERSSDGVIGYYETTNGVFLEPKGTGAPTAGAYEMSFTHVEVIGTPEEIDVLAIQPVSADNIVDGYGLNSSAGARQANANRCYMCIGYYPAGTTVVTRAKMTNLGGYLYTYRSETPSTTVFINSVSMSETTDIGGGWYERYATSTAEGYLYVQCTVNEETALEATWMVTQTAETASAEYLLAVGDYADTQDIISGAVERNVGVLVLDGTETWGTGGASVTYFYNTMDDIDGAAEDELICTHYPATTRNTLTVDTVCIRNNRNGILFSTPHGTTMTEWTEYLAAQYAAGTPVIVLYPLAEPTTDSVTGQHLSTFEGTNVVSIVAEVSPITVEVEYMAKSSS